MKPALFDDHKFPLLYMVESFLYASYIHAMS